MKCSKCEHVEMKMYEVTEENKMIFRCKQCGNEDVLDMTDVEKTAKKQIK